MEISPKEYIIRVDREVLMISKYINERWTKYFESLLNVEYERTNHEERVYKEFQIKEELIMEEEKFTKKEFEEVMTNMRKGEALG